MPGSAFAVIYDGGGPVLVGMGGCYGSICEVRIVIVLENDKKS